MFDQNVLILFGEPAKTAINDGADRLDRAIAAADVEGIVGSSKDLTDSVAKTVITALGGTFGANADLPALGNQVMNVLRLHPAGLQSRPAVQKLSQAMITLINAVAQMRNRDGTGHGRAEPSNLHQSHADLVSKAAVSWGNWALVTGSRVLEGRRRITEAAARIGGPRPDIFTRGGIPELLESLDLSRLNDEDQRQLGMAVGRRWSVGRTFLALEDVITPLAAGEQVYPDEFAAGVILGLFFEQNGFLVATPQEIGLATQIGRRLPVPRRRSLFKQLEEQVIQEAHVAFGRQAGQLLAEELVGQADIEEDPDTRRSLVGIAVAVDDMGLPDR